MNIGSTSLLFFVCVQNLILPTWSRKVQVMDNCKPKPKPGVPQHVIGYGSLMNSVSKNRTYPATSPNIPIEVKGFRRLWNAMGVAPTLSTTYLGVVRDPKSSFNAVYFTLENGEQGIKNFDTRESLYCRRELELDEFSILISSGNRSFDGQFWIYVTKPEFIAAPSDKYPIVQSYVDIWLSGCFAIEEKFNLDRFAERCVKSTGMWSNYWVNDRIFPRRPFQYSPKAGAIDTLLNGSVHEFFIQVSSEAHGSSDKVWRVLMALGVLLWASFYIG